MKSHITNLYNFNPSDELVQKQHRFANAGRELGFTEMGIFSYPVETDTPSELSKRLDGIIAALEPEDVVFMQLPTRNGFIYENLLFQKIKAYRAKVVFILHDLEMLNDSNSKLQEKYISLFKQSDTIIAPSSDESNPFEPHGIHNCLCYDKILMSALSSTNLSQELSGITSMSKFHSFFELYNSDFYLKKILIDAVETIFFDKPMQLASAAQSHEDEIQIGFGLHDKSGNYSIWVGTAMQSIIENTFSKICFHILHDNTLSDANKDALSYTAVSQGHRIQFHLLDESLFNNLVEQVSYFTIGTMFRIMLPELLPHLTKILYLDADILVNRDIKELWDIDIKDYALAAVPDFGSLHGHANPLPVKKHEVTAERYFNAGILSINLSYFQEKRDMKNEILQYLNDNKDATFPDQDALNSLYNKDTLLLDSSWNYFVRQVQESGDKQFDKKIYHYAATRLKLYSLTQVDYHYYETLCRTPWAKKVSIMHLTNALSHETNRLKQLEQLISQVVKDKKHIFYGSETFAMRNIYKLLPIKDGDYRILSESQHEEKYILPCQSFSRLLNEQKGNFIVLVLPEADNGTSLTKLENLGLVNGIDFFVIPCILPPAQGGYV